MAFYGNGNKQCDVSCDYCVNWLVTLNWDYLAVTDLPFTLSGGSQWRCIPLFICACACACACMGVRLCGCAYVCFCVDCRYLIPAVSPVSSNSSCRIPGLIACCRDTGLLE